MSVPPSGSEPPPDDDDNLGDLDDLDDRGGADDVDPSEEAASDPEAARQEAEDALAQIEALADLDETPDAGENAEKQAEDDPSGAEAASGGSAAASAAPDAEGGPDADPASSAEDGPREDQCENCGALLDGPYCSQCGQKAADRIVPIWHMINEALEAVFELDLRVLRTLPKFLFLPGRLTKEYINGRRKRYIRPFRLYLFATFLLFAVIALTTTGNFGFVLDPQGTTRFNPPNTAIQASFSSSSDTTEETTVADSAAAPDSSTASDSAATSSREGSLFNNPEHRKKLAERIRTDTNAVQINAPIYGDSTANARLEALLRKKMAQAVENPWEAVGSMIDRGPYLMFLMLPIFAFLLKLLYIRRGRLYVEHLIFSLHVHALAFFAFTVGILLNESSIDWLNATAPWVDASPLLYLILAMSHVYDQGLIKSTLKASILLLIYSIVLATGFALLLLVAILLM
ncbi:hypothetical protein BSZ35_07295 [Salinibacter sp. 10B]|uniref:DUF3667 domain-containing protein n=1 Tax=Salinibacter sp. 10B TaxID=1923971 RepID=UPI000CF5283D|nr:DUF3667 domain-containing protein [Salinibacter sp. 10B]PQJ34431.1 hypothetical protein BSZ35_07295 [Salinibacter sp. 10B]